MENEKKNGAKKERELTERQKKFCKEYSINLNGTQAAIRAGYSKKGADVQACNLLGNIRIQQFINKIRKKEEIKFDVSRERIIQEYANIALSDIRNYYDEEGRLKDIKDLDEASAAALAGVEAEELFDWEDDKKIHIGVVKKIKRWDKVKALDSLCKVFGYYAPDTHTHELGKSFFDYLKETS